VKIWINLNKKIISHLYQTIYHTKYISRVIVSQYFMCNILCVILWITDKWLLTLKLLRWRPTLFPSLLFFLTTSLCQSIRYTSLTRRHARTRTHTRCEFACCFKRHSRHVFYRTDKVKLITRITRSTLARVCNYEMRSTSYECRRAWRSNRHQGQNRVDFDLERWAEITTISYLIARTLFVSFAHLSKSKSTRFCPWYLLLLQHLHVGIRTG